MLVAIGHLLQDDGRVFVSALVDHSCRTFLDNRAECLAAMAFLTLTATSFRVFYLFIVLCYDPRKIVHLT